ncbi:C45 family autoproteolytic acyltransferase/hydrolase [Promethearchaeum syntrophicum]|uniref:C45 family autoproteolytic acyltransferase/hydrolase n=1 Tax=Promethearchaeum syntrophicum TaxID=2594042 RepID=A0A5B9DGZ7_9ARCH|nr:C45 family peptidase [Candidatus Prometheoarchaeum syntrophicum]
MSRKIRILIKVNIIFMILLIPSIGIINLASAAQISSIIAYSPDGKGYIEELSSGKQLIHMEGSPYEMGYQQGYLDPISVERLASVDWFKNVVLNLLEAEDWILLFIMKKVLNYNRLMSEVGSVVDEPTIAAVAAQSTDNLDMLLDKLFILCHELVAYNSIYVPQEFLDEIQGVADGATDAGHPVSYEEVLLLNMGMDALLALAYPVVEPYLFWMDLFSFLSCSGYVAQGAATTDGHTIMGRHWQFTSYVTHEEMILMEYCPDSGNQFLSTSCAGFVGVTSAMNDQGLGIGNDMVPAQDCNPANFGMGTLLTARYVMQYTNQLSEAINFITTHTRGCSWIYGIGDGRNGETGGVALETSTNYYRVRDMTYTRPWWAIFSFNTIEKKSDLVTYTNHYIYYRMNDLADSTAIDDSVDRYTWLTNLALDMYGTLDLDSGSVLIDYLHPPNYGYYGSDLTQPVGCAVTCWDLTTLEAKALFGYYNDDWVYRSL